MNSIHPRGGPTSARININHAHELDYWARELKVDKETIKLAVRRVGPLAVSVEEHLRIRQDTNREARDEG